MRLIDADALKSKLRAQEWKKDPAAMLALYRFYGLINEQPISEDLFYSGYKNGRWIERSGGKSK